MENFYKTLYSSQTSDDTYNASAPKDLMVIIRKPANFLSLKTNADQLLNNSRKIKPQVLTGSLRNFICVFRNMLQLL